MTQCNKSWMFFGYKYFLRMLQRNTNTSLAALWCDEEEQFECEKIWHFEVDYMQTFLVLMEHLAQLL